MYPQDFSGATSELAAILKGSGLGDWEVKETKDGTTFRIGKGPTVTYFDDKGQIIITGRRDTGYRAIVEWYLLVGLGHHMQMTHDYDMHRVTDLMSAKKGGKRDAVVTRTSSAGAVQNTPSVKNPRKKIEVTLIEDTDVANDADDTPEETVQEPALGGATKEDDASDVTVEAENGDGKHTLKDTIIMKSCQRVMKKYKMKQTANSSTIENLEKDVQRMLNIIF